MAKKFQTHRKRKTKPLQRELKERKVFVLSILAAVVVITLAVLSSLGNASFHSLGTMFSKR